MKRGSFAAPNGNWCGSLSGVGTSGSGNAWPPNMRLQAVPANQVRAVERSRCNGEIRRRPPDSVCRNSSRYSPNKKEPDRPADAAAACPRTTYRTRGLGCCSEGTSVLRGDHWNLCRADSRRALKRRGASGAIQHIFRRLFGRDISTPCANTGRLWICVRDCTSWHVPRNRLTIGCGWLTIPFSWMPFSACWWSVYDYTSGSKIVVPWSIRTWSCSCSIEERNPPVKSSATNCCVW